MGGQARASTSSSCIGRAVQRSWRSRCPWRSTVQCLVVGLGPLHGSQQPEEELSEEQRIQKADLVSDMTMSDCA